MATIWQVEVFGDGQRAGQRLVVVLGSDGHADEDCLRLTATLGPATAFVTGPAGARRLRCGPPTAGVAPPDEALLAAAAALDEGPVTFSLAGGEARIVPEPLGGETIWWCAQPAPDLAPCEAPGEPLLAALGRPAPDPELPWLTSPAGDLLLPLRDVAAVDRLAPDGAALATALAAAAVRGVAVFANPGPTPFELRVRYFSPGPDGSVSTVVEAPATPAVHGPLAVYLHGCELVPHFPEELRALSLQGPPAGPQSVLWLRLELDEATDLPTTVHVGGEARLIAPREI